MCGPNEIQFREAARATPRCHGESHLSRFGIPRPILLQYGGTYLVMEGPQFSTKDESHLYRQWQCDVIGMTNMPEAKLTREAEICDATVAMVTDDDCWLEEHDAVSVDQIIEVLHANADHARQLVKNLVPALKKGKYTCKTGCPTALEYAITTQPENRDAAMVDKLTAIAGRAANA